MDNIEEKSLNFIEEIIEKWMEENPEKKNSDPFSSRAQRLPAYRTRQSYLPEFWASKKIWWQHKFAI